MATISSPGIGSGLDIQSLVTQLVALEKTPLNALRSEATAQQTRLSLWGTIKSQVSALGDAAATLAQASGWNAVTARSSNDSAVGVSASAGAAQSALSVEVQRLAQAQSTASTAVASGTPMGTGTLTIDIGTWSGSSFTAGSASPVSVAIESGKDTLADIAKKINDAQGGVSASVLHDASGDRLMLRSTATGAANGFRVTVDEADDNDPDTDEDSDATGLSRLAYAVGNGNGQTLAQAGLNALATINNVPVSSASNTLSGTIEGLTIQLNQVTAAPVAISVGRDDATIQASIKSFVDAYNTLNNTLVSATRYDDATKKAGALQGDATATGLTNVLRSMMRSVTASAPFNRLSDIGLELKSAGKMEISSTRLGAAFSAHFDALQNLFTKTSADKTARGFGLKVSEFTDGLLDTEGMLSHRTDAIQAALRRNSSEQDKVSDRASRVEARLLAQYNAMDAAVARLNGLGSFVNQQITLWNKR